MKQEDFNLQGLTPEAAVEYMKNLSFAQDVEPVQREINEDIKEQLKDFVVTESTSIIEKTIEMKAINKEFNDALKAHKEGVQDALVRLKKGYTEDEETVYLIDDQEQGMMNVFDAQGKFLYQRKLKPSERQTKMLSMKTGTND